MPPAQTLSIRNSAPAASATFLMGVTFEVTMASPRRMAPSTTATATMSSWPDFPGHCLSIVALPRVQRCGSQRRGHAPTRRGGIMCP